jgi:hypothetical protein
VYEHREEIHDDPEAGFERVGRCKHGDEVAVADRTTARPTSRASRCSTERRRPVSVTLFAGHPRARFILIPPAPTTPCGP